MKIRLLCERDAEAFLHLRKQVNAETSFMLREPDENALLAKQQLEQFLHNSPQDDLLILVAEHHEQLVGFLNGFEIEGTMRRTMFINGAYIDEYVMAKLLG